jgi:hypothetical protein
MDVLLDPCSVSSVCVGVNTDVSEEHVASIFRLEARNEHLPYQWTRSGLHGVTSQKTGLFRRISFFETLGWERIKNLPRLGLEAGS